MRLGHTLAFPSHTPRTLTARDQFLTLQDDGWQLSLMVVSGRRHISWIWSGSLSFVTYGDRGTGFGNGWWLWLQYDGSRSLAHQYIIFCDGP